MYDILFNKIEFLPLPTWPTIAVRDDVLQSSSIFWSVKAAVDDADDDFEWDSVISISIVVSECIPEVVASPWVASDYVLN